MAPRREHGGEHVPLAAPRLADDARARFAASAAGPTRAAARSTSSGRTKRSSSRSRTDRSQGTVLLSVSDFDGLPISLSVTSGGPFSISRVTLRTAAALDQVQL